MRRLEALLTKERLTRAETGNRAFDCVFCRPPDGVLRQRWETLRAERGHAASNAVAQALLLSYRSESGGSLWLLDAAGVRRSDVRLGARAVRTLEHAALLVSRELPALVAARRVRDAWTVTRIATGGETVLDGDSFGLSVCLLAAADRLGLPSPPNVAATAIVDSDGTLFSVGGLSAKFHVLNDWALGVNTVIVAASQTVEATALARELGTAWQIVGARSLAEAMVTAFPNFWADLLANWSDPAKLVRVAGDLHRLARDGSNQVLGWKGIADAAGRVVSRLPEGSGATKDARFAQLVAQRHEGHDALLELDLEYLAGMRRPLRVRCLAHIAQSHGDCADVLDPTIERALADTLPTDSRDDSVDDFRLLGATGRMLAAFFRYADAEVALRRAVQGWFELDCVPEASHPLSELLRVVALTGSHESFLVAVEEYAEPFLRDPRVDAVSRGFILYSLGRGHALLGNHQEGRHRLADDACDWSLLPDHLRALRLRWLVNAIRAEDAADAAEDCLKQLSALTERTPTLGVVATLAQLDSALHQGSDACAALGAFQTCKPRDYRRFVEAYGGQELGARIAREYRY